jgi:hypothetical protein
MTRKSRSVKRHVTRMGNETFGTSMGNGDMEIITFKKY